MDVLNRILELRVERGWSEYKLSVESEIPQTTISSWFRKKICPTVPSIEKICKAYNITLAQFFNEASEPVALTESQREMIERFNKLSAEQQNALLAFLSAL